MYNSRYGIIIIAMVILSRRRPKTVGIITNLTFSSWIILITTYLFLRASLAPIYILCSADDDAKHTHSHTHTNTPESFASIKHFTGQRIAGELSVVWWTRREEKDPARIIGLVVTSRHEKPIIDKIMRLTWTPSRAITMYLCTHTGER